ncbi:cardiolipin synthase [Peribacillus cavernae]|uniref:Cardiolipin synthase n=1 Tax=Peribacillus cavernae TaxID=1674310 RepID=A0A3S0TR61_9BACI|nr:cardiolipin synthase [Peribacillus cavernae]MDQ0219747.1 cardiolipin synthase [Peribacillus cavernae]RUQ25165.1 cardiolipin synthase [Peribacillus cavernae]
MKKRRMEFVFVIIIIASGYLVFFTNIPLLWKALCMVLYGVIILITIFSLMLENRSAHNTLLWIYVLLFLPVFGYSFYLYSGQLFLKGYLFKSKRINDREAFGIIGKKEKTPDFSKLNDHQRCFALYSDRVTLTKTNINTQTHILKNGEETFQEIKRKLAEAKDFIHMEYYTFRSDRLGKELIDILIDKVEKGIAVRFMYDAVGSISLSGSDIKKMEEAGIVIHPFLPIKHGFYNQKFNFRNHRKIIVIDGKVGFVGGLNVGVEYLGEDEDIGFWRDTHVVLEGEAVQTLHAVFLLDWEYVCGEMLFEDEHYMKSIPVDGNGLVHVVSTGPETQDMSDHFYAMISCATKSIWIASPYFVPNQAIRTALRIAAYKGVQVRIMVPEINDGFLTQYATRSYFPELLRSGIEIYTYKKGFLHKKIIIVDGDLASIGTANMDMRSFHLNFEVNLFLTGTDSIQDLVAHYEEDLQDCRRIRPVEFYKRGVLERSKESFARLFSGVL